MSIKKMTKEELESLSNKDVTFLVLEEKKKPLDTASLFKEIIKIKELPESTFEDKIGDFYTALSTDKRFLLLDDGKWDLRNHHTSDKILGDSEEEIEDEDEEEDDLDNEDDILREEIEDDYGDGDEDAPYDDTKEDLKDLVVIDEEDMELEQ